MGLNRYQKKIRVWKPVETRSRVRVRRSWLEDIMEDLQRKGIINWKKVADGRRRRCELVIEGSHVRRTASVDQSEFLI